MAIASMHTAYAQKNSIGTTWSLSGIGISYERLISEDTFAHVAIKAEMEEMFIGKTQFSGLSAAFTWNYVFAQIESNYGTPVKFFAGPGIAAGVCNDLYGTNGLFLGLNGRVGMQCIFQRNVDITIALAPVLGLHVSQKGENLNTRTYWNGLLQAIMPEIGISYRF